MLRIFSASKLLFKNLSPLFSVLSNTVLAKVFKTAPENKLLTWINDAQDMSNKFLNQADSQEIDLNKIPVKVEGRTQSLQGLIETIKNQAGTGIMQLLKKPDPKQLKSFYADNIAHVDTLKQVLSTGNLSELLGDDLFKQLQKLVSHLDQIPPSEKVKK
jgi:phosphatidylinositol kinase/protein kinase (PI-3  family)